MHQKTRKIVTFCTAAAFCLAVSTVSVSAAEVPQVTFDGLTLKQNSKSDAVWLHPEMDLSGYDKITYENVGMSFELVRRGSSSDFALSEKQQQGLARTLDEQFVKELGRSEHFALTDSPDASTLLVSVALLNVRSHVPEESMGRNRVFISSVGEATLVLEVRDAQTKAILARAVDRGEARAFNMMESNRINNLREVRQAAGQWARLLRKRLDGLAG